MQRTYTVGACRLGKLAYLLFYAFVLKVAAEKAITRMRSRIDGYGGVIVIDNEGSIGKAFSTIRMGLASIKEDKLSYGLDPNECNIVNIE